jgi:hypothetical protein
MDMNKVKLKWDDKRDPYIENGQWNHTFAMIIEKFGLPGGRYLTKVTEEDMDLTFQDPKDATMCRLMLSERI